MKRHWFCIGAIAAAALGVRPCHDARAESRQSAEVAAFTARPEIAALQKELERSMSRLRLPNREPPYYLAYWLLGFREVSIESHLGAVVSRDENSGRRLRVELRVGSAELDNSFSESSDGALFVATDGMASAPRDAGEQALRRSLWLLTDSAYRDALAAFDRKRTQRSGQVELEQRPADFSLREPSFTFGKPAAELPSADDLQRAVTEAAAVFKRYPAVHDGQVEVDAWTVDRSLVASDGTLGHEASSVVEFTLRCEGQAADGMPLEQSLTLHGAEALTRLQESAELLARQLTELSEAEVAPDYSGPVLFSGLAAPQVLFDLAGTALSGTPTEQEGPLARKLGKRVLPTNVDLIDDPQQVSLAGTPLVGAYAIDDEGVPSERVELVSGGRLRGYLMSRAPAPEVAASNGHGRSGLGSWARGAVGNLILSSRQPATEQQLQARLLRSVAAENAEYGIIVERFEPRGFSSQGSAPARPERVFKLYPNGRKVLVRGASLREMNVRDLRDVLAVGSSPVVFNVMVGTNGYPLPTSVAAPALLFEQVELAKPKRSAALPKPISRPVPERSEGAANTSGS